MSEQPDTKRQRRGVGRIYSRPNSPNLWIEYWHLGTCHRESCGSPLEQVARRLLRKRMGEIARKGRVTGREVEATTYDDCEALLLADVEANRSASYYRGVKRRCAKLRETFGQVAAIDITYDKLTAFKARRLKDLVGPAPKHGAKDTRKSTSPATVRLELVLLGRALRLGVMAGRVEHVPPIPRVTVDNARQGFCTPDEIERVIQHLPDHVAPVVRLLYWTGMRSGEALHLEWSRVDLEGQAINLRAADTKTRHARTIPFGRLRPLADLLRRQRAYVSGLEKETGAIIPQVFPGCSPITFKRWWRRAVIEAGLPALRPHDLRRSFARNAIRGGVSEGVTMAIMGHRTRAMLDRYNVTAASDLAEGMERVGAYVDARTRKAQAGGGS